MPVVPEVSPFPSGGPATPRSGPTDPDAAERALSERSRALGLLDMGEPASAVVVEYRDTGTPYNGTSVAEVAMVVEHDQHEPYRVVRYVAGPPWARLREGGPVHVAVLVDPDDRGNVLLRWDLRPLAG
jgi:hypothetical protein